MIREFKGWDKVGGGREGGSNRKRTKRERSSLLKHKRCGSCRHPKWIDCYILKLNLALGLQNLWQKGKYTLK